MHERQNEWLKFFSLMKTKLTRSHENFQSHENEINRVFTHENEINKSLLFLDVLVEKSKKKFNTLVYRKPTFTGQYTCWDSFGPKKRKLILLVLLFTELLKFAF